MRKILFFVIISHLVISCNNKSNEIAIEIKKEKNIDSSLPLIQLASLDENLAFISQINSFGMIDEDKFVITNADPANVILYSSNGKQLQVLSRQGRGPFEYINPALVRSFNQNIYIWCSILLKMIIFDPSGTPIKEYSFTKAIRDFAIYNNYICFYSAGGFDEPIINIYDMDREDFVELGYGEKTNEHEILMFRGCAGGLALKDNYLFFSPADKPTLYRINLDEFVSEEFMINDPDFIWEPNKNDPSGFLNDYASLIQYIFGNDIISNIFTLNNQVILQAEGGNVIMNYREIHKSDVSQRNQKHYIFDNDMDLQYVISSKSLVANFCLYSSLGNYLYALNLKEDFSKYELVKIDFDDELFD